MVRGAEAEGIGKKNQWNGGMNKVTIQHTPDRTSVTNK